MVAMMAMLGAVHTLRSWAVRLCHPTSRCMPSKFCGLADKFTDKWVGTDRLRSTQSPRRHRPIDPSIHRRVFAYPITFSHLVDRTPSVYPLEIYGHRSAFFSLTQIRDLVTFLALANTSFPIRTCPRHGFYIVGPEDRNPGRKSCRVIGRGAWTLAFVHPKDCMDISRLHLLLHTRRRSNSSHPAFRSACRSAGRTTPWREAGTQS